MDEIRDQMDIMNEIGDAISQPLGYGPGLDDEELENELDALAQEELDEKLLGSNPVPVGGISLPGVPQTELPASVQPPRPARQVIAEDEDPELAELRASMAM
jgi:charged multivesicular body protein 4